MASVIFLVLATAFAVVTGINDGGTLLSTGLKFPSPRAFTAVVLLCCSLAFVPMLVGTAVATTFVHRLVAFDDTRGSVAMAIAMTTAVLVVTLLSRRGLPTSLTLAVIGGVAGVGLGLGLAVDWRLVVTVLVVGIAAPFVGGAVAHGILRLASWTGVRRAGSTLVVIHRLAFGLECLAYAANDGQKVLAVFAIAEGFHAGGGIRLSPQILLLLTFAFGLGVVLGLPRVGRSLGDRVLPVDPFHAVSTELAAGGVVLATALIGVPVSMTQSVAGGLVGAGLTHSYRRIRWRTALKIALAWVFTLPTAVGVSAAAALLARLALG